jgi:hypothetical protein
LQLGLKDRIVHDSGQPDTRSISSADYLCGRRVATPATLD